MSLQPRIAYVLRAFPRLSETFILGEVLALQAAGAKVQIYALERVRHAVRHPAADALVPAVRWLPAALRTEALCPLSANHETPEASGRWLAAQLLRDDIQHVHAHFAGPAAAVAAVAAERTGIPFTFTAHAKDIFSSKVSWPHLRRVASKASQVITVSEYNRRFLAEKLDAGTRVTRLYNGVSLDAWQPARRRSRGVRILAVGRLVHKKGFHVLVEAMALLERWNVPGRATVIGDGVEQAALTTLAKTLGVSRRIRFAGARPAAEVRRAMRNATLVALPCVVARDGNQDALPTVLLEAAACAVPAVSTRVAGIPEIIAHRKSGYVVAPDDALALARSMRLLIERPGLRQRMGRQARLIAERRFDQQHAVASLLRIFGGATNDDTGDMYDARHAALS